MKVLLNIKTDKKVKIAAQKCAKELGMPLSIVMNAYLKEFIRSKEVRFSLQPRMTPALEELIGKTRKDYRKKKNISPVFHNAKDAIQYLRAS